MKNWSLRRRLQILTASVVATALVIFGIGTAINLYYEQREALDERLSEEVAPVLEQMEDAADPRPWLADPTTLEILELLPRASIIGPGDPGEVLLRSPDAPDLSGLNLGAASGFRTILVNGEKVRLGLFQAKGLRVVVAGDLTELGEIVSDLMLAYLLALPLAVLAAAFGSWWITEKALGPIAAIAATAEAVTAQRLDHRLPAADTGDEIAHLGRILNRMFDRLERSFHTAQRFSADASHELRTPLTIMRGRLEEALRQPGRARADESLLADLLDENIRLSSITENLLLLARADAAPLELHLAETDLTALVEETLEDAEILASARSLTLERDLPPPLLWSVDQGRLRQVMLNLLDNAAKYSEPGGHIRVTLTSSETACVCTVSNSGPEIPAGKAGKIFERFFRGNDARGGADRGAGLGLSICRELVHAHGGTLELAANRRGHIEFRFDLPRRPLQTTACAGWPTASS